MAKHVLYCHWDDKAGAMIITLFDDATGLTSRVMSVVDEKELFKKDQWLKAS